jgi:hypothetical protein
MKSIVQRVLIAAGLLCVLCWDAAPAHAGDPAPASGSIFDGQWSCEFRVVTKPGGTPVTTVAYDSIQNQLFTAIKSSFQVDKNGSFSWEERKNSHWHADSFYAYKSGKTTFVSWDEEAILKVAGQVIDTKTRALKVTVEHWLGSGRFTDSMGGGTIDGSSQTYFAVGRPSGRYPLPHVSFVCESKPVSIEQQDLGPDQQREIVTYKRSRGVGFNPQFHVAGDGNWYTEHIEIRQVRELKLVPRG